MPKQTIPLLAFNRGIVSPKALARTDVERTALSAARMNNWYPKTQGAMTLRPGTKYLGSSYNDTGAVDIEFNAAVGQTALLELTPSKMRVLDGATDTLISRPAVAAISSISADTGAYKLQSTGGGSVMLGDTGIILNATNIGGLAKVVRKVILTDTGEINVEHALAIHVARGPVVFRCGSDTGLDDYVTEANLYTGRHSLSFTPIAAEFHMTFQSDLAVNKTVTSVGMDTGTLELTTPWTAADLANVRYDQSADVVYVGCQDVRQQKIERRGTGRSWSVVNYHPDDGPFLPGRTSKVRLKVAATYGNTTLTSDLPFFTSDHVGAIFRLFHNGQSGVYLMGREDTVSDVIEVTGSDTGTTYSANQERSLRFVGSGVWAGTHTVQRSYDGADIGFHDTDFTDTGTFDRQIEDQDDNLTVWYRSKIKTGNYTSGTLTMTQTYVNGGKTGICRVTGFTSKTVVNVEVLERFSSTDYTDDWSEGAWSDQQGFPDAPALSEGRLWWTGGTQAYGSVSDDYENFDDTTEGDAGPITRSIGRGPVNRINFMLPGAQLLLGTSGSEIAVLSSSLGETLTPDNALARVISTQGSKQMRAVLIDTQAIFVQRAGNRVYSLGYDANSAQYSTGHLTKLVPDLLVSGVTAMAVQRQPDTRIHFVMADGTAAMLSYDEVEELLCWTTRSVDTGSAIESVAVLPGTGEDQVYWRTRRSINGATKRYLERAAMESECVGDTGNWLADCAKMFTDTGTLGATLITGMSHLAGERVVVWANDTGQASAGIGMDMYPDTGEDGSRTLPVVSAGGVVTLAVAKKSAVVGLPYEAEYQTTKLAFAAALGTALTQMKRVDKVGLILFQTHNNGLYVGSDTGNLDPLPRDYKGEPVDNDRIYATYDVAPVQFPGEFSEDARIWLKAKAPRPVTVLAAVPTLSTNERG